MKAHSKSIASSFVGLSTHVAHDCGAYLRQRAFGGWLMGMNRAARIASGIFIVGVLATGVMAVPAQAAPQGGVERAEIASRCSVPSVPAGTKQLADWRDSGVRHRVYRIKNRTPQSVSLYYKAAARQNGFRVLTWGGGITYHGTTPGSGFGITAKSRDCGFLAVEIGAGKGKPTFFEICTGVTRAALDSCAKSPYGGRTAKR